MGEFFEFIDNYFRCQSRASMAGSLFAACIICGAWIAILFTAPDSLYTRFVLGLCGASILFYVVVAVRILFVKPPRPEQPVDPQVPSSDET